MLERFKRDVPLAPLTTLQLGGAARYFFECNTETDLIAALQAAEQNNLPVFVLGGGSNVVISDEGFSGLVIKIAMQGVVLNHKGDDFQLRAAAGEVLDEVIDNCLAEGLSGLELLSGIPGLVGATPVQNVGAYGIEVADVISGVRAIDRQNGKVVNFSQAECNFGYRNSRFKGSDSYRYIITEVNFALKRNGRPRLVYPELCEYLESTGLLDHKKPGPEELQALRKAVLELRGRKSMVTSDDDPESRSCGSFFTNPILSLQELQEFEARCNRLNLNDIPIYELGSDNYKVAAAWLVEHAGFQRGYVSPGGVGISKNHSLALININGSSSALLELADKIRKGVIDHFGIELMREPVLV